MGKRRMERVSLVLFHSATRSFGQIRGEMGRLLTLEMQHNGMKGPFFVRSSAEIARKEDGLWGMVIAVAAAVERGAIAALAEDTVVAVVGTVEEDSRLRPEAALLLGLWPTIYGRHPDDVRPEVAGG